MPRNDDVLLPVPTVRHADVAPAIEDRSYIGFFAGALLMALGGGFLLAIALSLLLAGRITWPADAASLSQAHGWAQLQGWAGLFVAGMALRLIPRFAGRRPLPRSINLVVLLLLLTGAVGRTAAQSLSSGTTAGGIVLAAMLASVAGTAAVSATVGLTLARGRKRSEPWRFFAWAGVVSWLVWAALLAWAGLEARHDGVVPGQLDQAMVWFVMLAGIGNFIWAVQSRSVPIFFGRKLPSVRQLMAPAVLLNGGALVILLSTRLEGSAEARINAAGLLAAGCALIWLPLRAGSVWGAASRLRPRARTAARYVLIANIAAVVAGMGMAISAGATLASGEAELYDLQDAARHALGLGLITALIFGMARLVAPVFALQRNEARGPDLLDLESLWAIAGALFLRVGASAASGLMNYDVRMELAAAAGILGWLAVALFAASVVRAVTGESAMRAIGAARPRGTADR